MAAAEQEVWVAADGDAGLAAHAEEEEEEEIDPALRPVDPADGRWVCIRTLGDYRGNNYNQMMDRYF